MSRTRNIPTTFIIAAAVLLIAAVALQTWVSSQGWILRKKPVYPARELKLIPTELGRSTDPARTSRYVVVRKEPRLNEDVEKELGTTRYISWIFEDTDREPDEPGKYIRVHIPYYTGTIDAVPHVSDRCHVAAGAKLVETIENVQLEPSMSIRERTEQGVVVMDVNGRVLLPQETVPATFNRFHNPRRDETYCVTYFFIANNRFVGSRYGVRAAAFDLTNEYAYYAKVEVLPVGVNNKADAIAVTEEFLAAALPEIMRCMPDWQAVTNSQERRADPLETPQNAAAAPSGAAADAR